MGNDEPDYTTYALPDLRDAQRNIDRRQFPDRAARLDAEIARRSLNDEIIQGQLAQLVRDVEYYKVVTGHYPNDLKELQSAVPDAVIYDTSRIQMQMDPFYFQLRDGGTTYHLFSAGPDRKPFTSDDLQPRIPEDQRKRTGLRLPGS